MITTARIFEINRLGGSPILAISYRNGRAGKPVFLPDGAIVEAATPPQNSTVPDHARQSLALGPGGQPATIHDEVLGLVRAFVAFGGVFTMGDGKVVALYGASAVPLG